MSDLDTIIEINRNIEKQNEEIIRLLKKIAGEEEEPVEDVEEVEEVSVPEQGQLLDTEIDVGEVYFVDDGNVFKLSVINNETIIDNLTGNDETINFKLQEIIANESISKNKSLPDSTVILNNENIINLPDTLKICYQQGAKNVYIPWYAMTQLIGAPELLMQVMKLDFYKTDEELLEKLFG